MAIMKGNVIACLDRQKRTGKKPPPLLFLISEKVVSHSQSTESKILKTVKRDD